MEEFLLKLFKYLDFISLLVLLRDGVKAFSFAEDEFKSYSLLLNLDFLLSLHILIIF